MKVRVIYDGACPFCDDYVRYQKLRDATDELELIDAREHREVLAAERIEPAQLEDGDGERFDGADAVAVLSRLSDPPARWWVRAVAAVSRSRARSRALYPILKLGRRVALSLLGVERFPK
jgi:predicted DCC family thiol-disulfide oxidoreductase YuxK